ncbi:uncharacterized protein LOC142346155 [Convolutriloba macropyga]|uniref:uncharacterized protein LOC142346155 n=1 Tax=Convolutriloba macropyga TaxID=536237 RepID=UPI003F522064
MLWSGSILGLLVLFFGIINRYEASVVRFETRYDQFDRNLLEFEVLEVSKIPSVRLCGLICTRAAWCKSYNHNHRMRLCELIMTELRLLNTSTVSSIASHGWHHYTPSPRVRGCTEIETLECVQIWPDGTLTTSDSITILWSLPDQYDTEFKVDQELTIKHDEHLAQFSSINANVEDHNLDSLDRSFSPIEAMIPGVLYQFQLIDLFEGRPAQFPLLTSESTYPSSVDEVSALRQFTEHTIEFHWTFVGSAQFIDIWTVPNEGSCLGGCQISAVGTDAFEITELTAGREYTVYTQLTSFYGKKGPVRHFVQSTYTDIVLSNFTTPYVDSIVFGFIIESGLGSVIVTSIRGTLGSVYQQHHDYFSLANQYFFVNLDPGDLYTIEVTVYSQGDFTEVRHYVLQESTHPEEPKVIFPVVATEHTLQFGWAVGNYFQKLYIWTEPADGECAQMCTYDNTSPNSDTITGLVAGQHYQIFLMSESQYNKNSSVLWFTQSVFTDTILETEEIFSVHEIEFEAQIESGVGSKIEIEMQGLDFPWLRRSLYFLFRLDPSVTFSALFAGSMYRWTLTVTSRGLNPLQRIYHFQNSTMPAKPIALVEAAATLDQYDTFTLTIGNVPYVEGSPKALRLSWAQELMIHSYKITLIGFTNYPKTFDVISNGWEQLDSTELNPGELYQISVTPVSYGKEGESNLFEESTNPSPPTEISARRNFTDKSVGFHVSYEGTVTRLHLWLIPAEGSCVSGCSYPAPSTTDVLLTYVTPGEEYAVRLTSESNSKMSAHAWFYQSTIPGEIMNLRTVAGDDKIFVEFQIESGTGSEIEIEYSGMYSNTEGKFTFDYRLTNRRTLNSMTPGETYNLLLITKSRGSNPLQRTQTFKESTYPSPVTEDSTSRVFDSHSIRMKYTVIGLYKEIKITSSPAANGCPCITYDSSGYSMTSLVAGEEYNLFMQTISRAGLQSAIRSFTQSLPVDRVTSVDKSSTTTEVSFTVHFESGVGSTVFAVLKDESGSTIHSGTLDFSLDFNYQRNGLVPGTCHTLSLEVRSRGSYPQLTQLSYLKGTVPAAPLEDDPGGVRNHFKLSFGDSETTVATEKALFFDWYQIGQVEYYGVVIAKLGSAGTFTVNPNTGTWTQFRQLNLKAGESYEYAKLNRELADSI